MPDDAIKIRAAARDGGVEKARAVLEAIDPSDRSRAINLARQLAEHERDQAAAPVDAAGAPVDDAATAAELEVLAVLAEDAA